MKKIIGLMAISIEYLQQSISAFNKNKLEEFCVLLDDVSLFFSEIILELRKFEELNKLINVFFAFNTYIMDVKDNSHDMTILNNVICKINILKFNLEKSVIK